MKKFFYLNGDTKLGPFSRQELKDQNLKRNTKIWFYGLDDWTPLNELEELKDIFLLIPPEIKVKITKENSTYNQTDNTSNHKSIQKKVRIGKFQLDHVHWIIITILAIIVFMLVINTLFKNSHGGTSNKFQVTEVASENEVYEIVISESFSSEEDFDLYLNKFYRDLEFFGIYPPKPYKTIIKFSNLDKVENLTHYHGLSFGTNDDQLIEIYINPTTWRNFNKAKRYWLIYHELAHDVLNLEDLEPNEENIGRLMYPNMETYMNLTMDEFIESVHELFEELGEDRFD